MLGGWPWDFFTINMLVFREVKQKQHVQKTSKKPDLGVRIPLPFPVTKGESEPKNAPGASEHWKWSRKTPKGSQPFWVKTSKKLTASIVGSTLFWLKHPSVGQDDGDTVIYSP